MSNSFTEALILRLCKQPRSFEFISRNLYGLEPVELIKVLDILEKKKRLQRKEDLWVIKDNEKHIALSILPPDKQLYLKKYMGYFDFLKTSHPLDFEWRNTTQSLYFLLDKLVEINSANDAILILGMPTLFATSCLKDIPNQVTLIEKNEPIVRGLRKLNTNKDRFKILKQDIFSVSKKDIGNFQTVIMDPPWYTPHYIQFMWLAAQCVNLGGIVGISLPPYNTRPNIDEERIDWFKYAQKQGLVLESLYPGKLHYTMPFFEFNAFRAAGIGNVLPFWRKGDLAFFRKVRQTRSKRPILEKITTNWIEKELGNVRIRVIMNDAEIKIGSPLKINSLINGDILPTVSTRNKIRKQANVWTSGNRIFDVNNPNKFLEILESIEEDQEILSEDAYAVKLIKNVISLEQEEYNEYLDWIYHEMEKQIS